MRKMLWCRESQSIVKSHKVRFTKLKDLGSQSGPMDPTKRGGRTCVRIKLNHSLVTAWKHFFGWLRVSDQLQEVEEGSSPIKEKKKNQRSKKWAVAGGDEIFDSMTNSEVNLKTNKKLFPVRMSWSDVTHTPVYKPINVKTKKTQHM